MPLFNQDPEISRRFGLGLGAGLLNTHGRPAGAIMSDALMLGQKNADTERELRVKDATARYYGQRGQVDLFGVAKDLHAQKYDRWALLKRASTDPTTGVPDPGDPPDIAETMMEVFQGGTFGGTGKGPGVMAGPQGMPAAQQTPHGPGVGVGPQPMPPSAPGASQRPADPLMPSPGGPQPGQLGSGTAGIMSSPLGVHRGPPGRPEPIGPAQVGPPPTMGDMAPLQRSAGAAPQQPGIGSAQQQALAQARKRAAWGLAKETDVSLANAMKPYEAGGMVTDPVLNIGRRNLPDGFEYGPDGKVRRIGNLAEEQQRVKTIERTGELAFDLDHAPQINARDRLKAFSTEAGKLDATAKLGRAASRETTGGAAEGQYDVDQRESKVPGVSNKALGAAASVYGNVVEGRDPNDGSTFKGLQGELMPPGSDRRVPTGATTEQQLARRNRELRQDTEAGFERTDFADYQKDAAEQVKKARTAAQSDDAIEAMRPNIHITGKLTPFAAGVGGWLTALNVAPDYVRDFTSSAQSLGAIINDQVIKNSVILEGQLSNRDMTIVQASYANLGHTPEGNAFVLDFMSAVNERIKLRAGYMADLEPLVRSGQITKLQAAMRIEDKLGDSVFDTESMKGWRYLVGKE